MYYSFVSHHKIVALSTLSTLILIKQISKLKLNAVNIEIYIYLCKFFKKLLRDNNNIYTFKMKKYNIINNTLGWLVFIVATITYMLTIEPTASFWDCPEFIAQGYKLEIGHPPGNPMFILGARFAANFAGGDVRQRHVGNP